MLIRKSAEDYLETILMLKEKHGSVHSVDVAAELGFSKASVSVAMKKLRESGHLIMEADGELKLTESGYAIAHRIYERHRTLTQFFIHLGVSPDVAAEDACKVEHDLSEETFQHLLAHARKNTGEAANDEE